MSDKRWAPPPMNPYKPMIINVALTGAVPTKADSPKVPLTPEEIAQDAIECAKAGASIVHIHVRDENGEPVHRRDLYERAIGPIRDAMPELCICVTTSGRVDPDPAARMIPLELEEELRPDMASLTVGSFNFPQVTSVNPPQVIKALLEKMRERGIKPELEVFEPGMINTIHSLQDKGLLEEPLYVNILLGSLGSSPAFVRDLVQMVDRLPPGTEWAAAGIGVFQRSMTVAAAVMGGNVRTGLEDAPRTPDGEGNDNVSSVESAATAAAFVGREVADAAETRRRLGLSQRDS